MADVDLIAALRSGTGTKPALVIPKSLNTQLAATPEGQCNQVTHMLDEIMQAFELGRANLPPLKLKTLREMKTDGVKTLEDAQWIIDIYAQHKVFNSIWVKPQ